MGIYEPTEDDERDINSLEPLLNLPDVFAAADPEDDEEGCVDEGYAWRWVLRREKDRQLVRFIERQFGIAPITSP